MSRQNEYAVTVTIDGIDYGVYDKLSGGEVDSEELTYSPGAMAPKISLGGIPTVGQVVISRLYVLERDHLTVHTLMQAVGKADAVIKKQPLDSDRNAFGRPLTYSGKLKRVSPPEHDSESTDAALIEIEITPAGTVT